MCSSNLSRSFQACQVISSTSCCWASCQFWFDRASQFWFDWASQFRFDWTSQFWFWPQLPHRPPPCPPSATSKTAAWLGAAAEGCPACAGTAVSAFGAGGCPACAGAASAFGAGGCPACAGTAASAFGAGGCPACAGTAVSAFGAGGCRSWCLSCLACTWWCLRWWCSCSSPRSHLWLAQVPCSCHQHCSIHALHQPFQKVHLGCSCRWKHRLGYPAHF